MSNPRFIVLPKGSKAYVRDTVLSCRASKNTSPREAAAMAKRMNAGGYSARDE